MLQHTLDNETVAYLAQQADGYLHKLCVDIKNRSVGSAGNRAATAFFVGTMGSFGFDVETPEFECMDWQHEGAELSVGSLTLEPLPSPYSLGCDVSGPLVVVSSAIELERVDITGAIVLLRGEITREQLMPKSFTFYNPDEHRHIIALLEAKQPAAIITATGRDPNMAGSLYPFPLIEDGDFDIPSVYVKDIEGDRLVEYAGTIATLASRAARKPSTGYNVIARMGSDKDRRVVLFAHIDAKQGTPGALDNASGVITLLLLAELLSEYNGSLQLELVALNGEDYYANPGEYQYLRHNEGRFGDIVLGINVDGAGYRKGNVAYSLYGCPQALAETVRDTFSCAEGIAEGEPWYQGDHVLFIINQAPALAVTSELVSELMSEVIHTSADRPELVDSTKLATLAGALRDIILRLDQ